MINTLYHSTDSLAKRKYPIQPLQQSTTNTELGRIDTAYPPDIFNVTYDKINNSSLSLNNKGNFAFIIE